MVKIDCQSKVISFERKGTHGRSLIHACSFRVHVWCSREFSCFGFTCDSSCTSWFSHILNENDHTLSTCNFSVIFWRLIEWLNTIHVTSWRRHETVIISSLDINCQVLSFKLSNFFHESLIWTFFFRI